MSEWLVPQSLCMRTLRLEDLDRVYSIYMSESVIPYLGIDPTSKTDFAELFARFLRIDAFFVFELQQDVIGFANVMRQTGRSRHVAHLGPIALDPALHGTGTARAMLELVLGWLHASGIRRVELIVESDNPRAIRFYEKCGFEIEGTLRGAYRRGHEDRDIDSHIMARLFETSFGM